MNNNSERNLLLERIRAIKQANIQDVKICNPNKIKEIFLKDKTMLKPRHTRDISRFCSLVKAFALLNLWWRERHTTGIIANEQDIEDAKDIWDKISISQEYNLSPYVYNIWTDVILPCYESNDTKGLTRQEILKSYHALYGRPLADWKLRNEIIPMLEASGLITQESDPADKRVVLVYPNIPKQ